MARNEFEQGQPADASDDAALEAEEQGLLFTDDV